MRKNELPTFLGIAAAEIARAIVAGKQSVIAGDGKDRNYFRLCTEHESVLRAVLTDFVEEVELTLSTIAVESLQALLSKSGMGDVRLLFAVVAHRPSARSATVRQLQPGDRVYVITAPDRLSSGIIARRLA